MSQSILSEIPIFKDCLEDLAFFKFYDETRRQGVSQNSILVGINLGFLFKDRPQNCASTISQMSTESFYGSIIPDISLEEAGQELQQRVGSLQNKVNGPAERTTRSVLHDAKELQSTNYKQIDRERVKNKNGPGLIKVMLACSALMTASIVLMNKIILVMRGGKKPSSVLKYLKIALGAIVIPLATGGTIALNRKFLINLTKNGRFTTKFNFKEFGSILSKLARKEVPGGGATLETANIAGKAEELARDLGGWSPKLKDFIKKLFDLLKNFTTIAAKEDRDVITNMINQQAPESFFSLSNLDSTQLVNLEDYGDDEYDDDVDNDPKERTSLLKRILFLISAVALVIGFYKIIRLFMKYSYGYLNKFIKK